MAVLAAAVLLAPEWVAAESRFYVDTDRKGLLSNGSASAPWQDLSGGTWAAITKALAGGPVTVYFNSRQQRMGRAVELVQASARALGKNLLTFDGSSYYDSTEKRGLWIAETDPARKAPVEGFNAENLAHVKRSLVTIRGFKIIAQGGHKAVVIAGDNWTLENCDCSHAPGAIRGPCVLVAATSDKKHEGSAAFTLPCTNIVIRGNNIHDSYGEAIYVGGGGSQPGEPGSGYPSHDNILIESNIIHDAGTRGKQGDGIDVKGGISHVTIRGNDIYHLASFENRCDVRAIVMQGQLRGLSQSYVVERNRIHDCTGIEDGAIAIVDTWGVSQSVNIRNNVIYNISGKPGRPPSGIKIYSSADTVSLCNNTIEHCEGFGIFVVGGVHVILRNNLLLANHGGQAELGIKGVAAQSDYNAFEPPLGYASEGAHSLSLSAAQAAASLVNLSGGDFRLSSGSSLAGKGEALSGFADDFAGRVRGVDWAIGAFDAGSQ
jgi:hypothetical protein